MAADYGEKMRIMMKAILFGASGGGQRLYEEISSKYEILAFVDNDERKWGKTLKGIPILEPSKCACEDFQYDRLIITSAPGLSSIKRQCLEMGVFEDKIITSYVEAPLESRRIFLEKFSKLIEMQGDKGECAEAGVFEGDFAKWINQYFPDRKLFLFDTFVGFDMRDIVKEKPFSNAKSGDYNNTSIELVMEKMLYPQNCIISKGYFPQTAEGITEKFCFVNLDLDLYEPTYNGLLFFENKMTENGIILVHDYFADNFRGPKEAVNRFLHENKRKIKILPIGDGISVSLSGFSDR